MKSHRNAHRLAGFAIIACMAALPWSAHAASHSPDTRSDAPDKHKHAKAKTRATVHAPAPRRGLASYYSKRLAGRKTSSGQPYDPNALTAAHRSLPMGTRLKVVNPRNDKSVVVTVNDRGPLPRDRMIDLSNAAAKKLGMTRSGVAKVETEVVGKTDLPAANADKTPAAGSGGK